MTLRLRNLTPNGESADMVGYRLELNTSFSGQLDQIGRSQFGVVKLFGQPLGKIGSSLGGGKVLQFPFIPFQGIGITVPLFRYTS